MTIETIASLLETTLPVAVVEVTPLKRAVIYLRVSTSRQATKNGEAEGYSIPAQRSACKRRATDLGAEVVQEFVDAGASARSADRNGL
jgi:site-specific DNA recombinase